MRSPQTHILLALAAHATATYMDGYNYPTSPSATPFYLGPTLSSTVSEAFYPYPTSAAHNCSCHEPHQSHASHYRQPSNSLIISVSVLPSGSHVFASASASVSASAHPVMNETGNATYHSPGLLSTGVATTGAQSQSQSRAPIQIKTTTPVMTTTQDGAAASQSGSPTQSKEPADPLFTGSALTLRLPEPTVWRWNIIVGVGLGVMVMVI